MTTFSPKLTTAVTKKIDVEGHNASITIKHIKSGIMASINQDSMTVESRQGDGGMQTGITLNMTKKNRAIVTSCVTGWSGFEDDNGRPLKFSTANLIKMIEESNDFVSFVVEAQEKLNTEVEAEEEAEEKN
jgi:hypothetical protein